MRAADLWSDSGHRKCIPRSDVYLSPSSQAGLMELTQLIMTVGALVGILIVSLLAIVPSLLDLA